MGLIFVIGVTLGSSTHVIAQQTSIPSWVKNTALWWGQGQISDSEFIKSLQWLVDNGMIKIPQSQTPTQTSASSQSSTQLTTTSTTTSAFNNVVCSRDQIGIIHITGKFTSTASYSSVILKGAVEDSNGNVLATGTYFLENVQAGIPQIFDIQIIYQGNATNCEEQVESTIS